MPLYRARTSTASASATNGASVRISPRPGSATQNARTGCSAIRSFFRFCSAGYNPWVIVASYWLKSAVVAAAIAAVAAAALRDHHPFPRFGPANTVTSIRALLVAAVAGLIGEPHNAAVAWIAVWLGLAATLLDGADGWLARRTDMIS